jgi:plastocyanin domain-containing protein
MSELLVTLGGAILIALIVWWFWFSSPKAAHVAGSQPIDILVKDGTYQPAVIEVPAGWPLRLRFIRHDATPCAEKVLFGSLNITADLPLGKPQTVSISPLPPGTYEFTCQMGMYRGRLIAKR